jgi:hypothetical protein
MSGDLIPNSEMVAVAWLRTNVSYLDGNVATSLPESVDSWSDKGFTVVTAIGGDSLDLGLRRAVLSLMYYAVAQQSGRPPWNRAVQMAEQVREIIYPTGVPLATTRAKYHVTAMPTTYKDAKVQNVFMRSEPRRRPGDSADFAIYQNDIQLDWVVVPG